MIYPFNNPKAETMKLLIAALIGIAALGAGTTQASAPPTPVTEGHVTATLVDSYYSIAATQLIIVFEITSTAGADVVYATYLGPDSQQVEPSDDLQPSELLPGAVGLVAFMFPAATPGGTVTLEVYSDDADTVDIQFAVPA